MSKRILSALVTVLFSAGAAMAASVGGVDIPERATVGGQVLALNGAGLRTKFMVKVYAGALYLPRPAATTEEALSMEGPKRMHMHFIHKKLKKKKLTDAWREGFEGNLTAKEHEALSPLIDRFCALFKDTARGETYTFDYVPFEGAATKVYRNGKLLDTIKGEGFMRALLLIWLGERPADNSLKKAMLGG